MSEWYEFALYGFCVPVFANLFFPDKHQSISVLIVYAIFAAGFLLRPLGGLIYGYYGDRWGRKRSLTSSIILIGIPTFLMGVLPTANAIGIWAGLAIVVVRMFQGLSVGGEFAGSLIYLSEQTQKNNRGLYCGLVLTSAFVGMLLAAFSVGFLSTYLTRVEFQSYGWRIPFLVGIFVAAIGYYLRRTLPDTISFSILMKNNEISMDPIAESFSFEFSSLMKLIGICWLASLVIYLLFIYLPQFIYTNLHLSHARALIINACGMIALSASALLSSMLSDRIGRKPLLLFSSVLITILIYPIFHFLILEYQWVLLGQILLGLIGGIYTGPCFTVFPELFPTRIRYTSVALAYNIGFALFAGTAPLVATYFIALTGDLAFPAYYLMFVAVITVFIVFSLKETAKLNLDAIQSPIHTETALSKASVIKRGYNASSALKIFGCVFLPSVIVINFLVNGVFSLSQFSSKFIPAQELLSFRLHFVLYIFIASIVIASFTSILIYYFLYKQRADQAKLFFLDLITQINRDKKNQESVIQGLVESYKDQSVGVIAELFTKTMNAYRERQVLDRELEIAASIQKTMLPEQPLKLTWHENTIEVNALLMPAKLVGGDFYEYFMLGQSVLLFAIGDVTGKGVAAALQMARAIEVLKYTARDLYKKQLLKPELNYQLLCQEILQGINLALYENNEQSNFVTLLLGMIDFSSNKLYLGNAGHNFPYLFTGNNFELLDSMETSPPLGIKKNAAFSVLEKNLTPHYRIILYTDGVVEARNSENLLFSESRLENALFCRHILSGGALAQAVFTDVANFSNGVNQYDDLTLLCVDCFSSSIDKLPNKSFLPVNDIPIFSSNVVSGIIKAAKIFVKENLNSVVPDDVRDNMVLCCEEYLQNLITHGQVDQLQNSTIQVFIKVELNAVSLIIIDHGVPFDLSILDIEKLKTQQKNSDQIGGRGLLILIQLADELVYNVFADYNECVIKINRSSNEE